MKKLLLYIKPYAGRMAGGLSVKLFGSLMDLLLPWILAYMIDSVVPQNNIPLIFVWGGMMLVCSVIAILGNVIANRMAARVARNVTENLRHDLFAQSTALSCAQVDNISIPTLLTCLTSDTYNVHRMISSMQRMGVRAPILLIGGIIITMTLDPALSLTLVAVLPFITFVVFRTSRKGIPLYTKLQQAVDKMVRSIRENAAGIRVIKALSKTEYEKSRFDQVNQNVTDSEKKAGITMAVTNPMMNLFLNLGLVLVVLVGAFRVDSGLTQPGKIIAFLSYFTIILNAMLAVTRMFVILSQGTASANRIQRVMDMPEDLQLAPPNHIETDAHVLFDNVSYAYSKTGEGYDVADISFSLKRGQTLGIIGATGSGKSTLIQLLMRLYDVDKGIIRIGGDDVRSIPPEQLHAMFGIVFQNDTLFADSIGENIDFGRHLSENRIQKAARMAQAAEFVDAMEDGYAYQLTSRGTNLSGGQKQRLLIARALAAKPDILILDDSSSALDYRTDAKLRRAINSSFTGTTTIIVAQRISSIMYADHILVMDEGRIIGQGDHQHLLETNEIYREISTSQLGGAAPPKAQPLQPAEGGATP